jgi:DnaJ domain
VTQDQFGDNPQKRFTKRLGTMLTHYELLDLPSSATIDQVRRAYRLKSKLYHPDTTVLTPEVATQKFRELKEAYGVLNSPERRALYDMGQQPIVSEGFSAKREADSRNPNSQDRRFRSMASAYLDPKERPLSSGEMFAVFLLGATFVVCLVLAIVLGVARGEMVIQKAASSVNTGSGAIAALKKPVPVTKPSFFSIQSSVLKSQRTKAPEKPKKHFSSDRHSQSPTVNRLQLNASEHIH